MSRKVTLVTGGAGFVGTNVVRHLLERDDVHHVIVFDRVIADQARDYLAPHGDRVQLHVGDITDLAAFDAVPDYEAVTHIVHGAMVAHVPAWELADPTQFVNVNVLGTINTLEWARRLPALRRFLYVSSGGVYGEAIESSPEGPQAEDGPFNPPELYAISKYASELLSRRYGALFGLDIRIARLSWVFGPMERVTSGRALMSPPYAIARALVEDRPVTVTRRTLAAVGDFLSAEDVAVGVATLLHAENPRHTAYNIALGTLTRFDALLEASALAQPAARFVVTDNDHPADLDHDPSLRRARWNAYDIGRMRREFDWEPRPLAEQLRTYLDWVLGDPIHRCPSLSLTNA